MPDKKSNVEKEVQQAKALLNINTQLKNIWVDTLHMAVRDDDIVAIKLSADLPEGAFEQIRFMTSKKRLQEFVDTICNTIKYQPKVHNEDVK